MNARDILELTFNPLDDEATADYMTAWYYLGPDLNDQAYVECLTGTGFFANEGPCFEEPTEQNSPALPKED